MPRYDGSEAAQAGAADSLSDVVDGTNLLNVFSMTAEELAAQKHTDTLDMQHFAAHPSALSYVRAYHPGEISRYFLAAYQGQQPEAVAVALVFPGRRARVFIWPGMPRSGARRSAEEGARRERIKLGMQGQA